MVLLANFQFNFFKKLTHENWIVRQINDLHNFSFLAWTCGGCKGFFPGLGWISNSKGKVSWLKVTSGPDGVTRRGGVASKCHISGIGFIRSLVTREFRFW